MSTRDGGSVGKVDAMIGEKTSTGKMNRTMMPLLFAGVAVLAVLGRVISKGAKNSSAEFKNHSHGAIEHTHDHVHVTHERSDPGKPVGGWTHLTAEHSHRHNHASLEYSHRPHRDLESEHSREAHIHDHEHPTTS